MLLALCGCVRYHALPLETRPTVLYPPSATLQHHSGGSERPYLRAVEIDLSRPLDGNAVAVLTVMKNPALLALRRRADIASAQSFSAGLLPDPTFRTGHDFLLAGPDPLDNLTAGLSIDLVKTLIQRSTIAAQARAATQQVRYDLAWAEWQSAGAARISAVRILSLEQVSSLDASSRDATQGLLDATLRAAGRGDLGADRVQAPMTAAFDASERQRTSERDLSAARFDLVRLLGLPPSTELRLQRPDLPTGPVDANALFADAQQQRFDLQALRAGYVSQEAAVRKAILDQFPRLDLSVNATRDTTNNRLLGPAVDFTLPLWNRNRGGIAVERATRAALKAEYEARLFDTRADIAAAVAGIELARKQRQAILDNLPALSRYAQGSRRAADRGDLAAATAASAEQALRDKQSQLIRSEQAIEEQWIALELLTGAPLQGTT